MRKLKWTVNLEDLPVIDGGGRLLCPFCDHPLPKHRTNKRKMLALAKALRELDEEAPPILEEGQPK